MLTLETNKYAIRLDNFEGPLDLLYHLIDKNKMDIHEVNISQITDQYIAYLSAMEELNLDIASEFVLMASTLLYLKSKSLLPKQVEDEGELTEDELMHRIIEYKKYKEISKKLKEEYEIYSKRCFKLPDKIELPKKRIESSYIVGAADPCCPSAKGLAPLLANTYKNLLRKMEIKENKQAKVNIKKIAVTESVTVTSKVKDIFRELLRKPKFVFNNLCTSKKYTKLETVTAFTGLLELSRKNKVQAKQEKNFGDITVEKVKRTTIE
ncbi:MAG: segregation/condensation protein A [Oscillospiraceae bacterium]|nr:segregation/condensation protein A [Oscillospiraceae bacterium]